MTIITKTIRSSDGVASIEATIILPFFIGMMIYVFQQLYVITATFAAEKIASQVAILISQRNILFDNNPLAQKDFNEVKKFIPILANRDHNPYDIYIEELSYSFRRYNVISSLQGNKPQCTINKTLATYNFSIQTSFGRSNSVYRVLVCRKLAVSVLFSNEPSIISGISVFPGQHH